jgi:8-oxo-dGTP diphosphatase
VAVIQRESRVLIIRRSMTVAAPGAFCFPGGGIELGESEEAALVRELREELCVEVRPVRRLWRSVTPWEVELAWWQADLEHHVEPVPCEAEVASCHWMRLDELATLEGLLESNLLFLEAVRNGQVSLERRDARDAL